MNGDWGGALWGVGALVLVGGALIARRPTAGQTARYVGAWLGIFAVIYVGFLFRDDVMRTWERASADLGFGNELDASGSVVVLRRETDGHFHANVTINGTRVRMLVDSGATSTAVSREMANATGVEIAGGMPVMVETANGTVLSDRGRIASLQVGTIHLSDYPVLVGDGIGDEGLLGMTFLDRLKRWSVEGDSLRLEP